MLYGKNLAWSQAGGYRAFACRMAARADWTGGAGESDIGQALWMLRVSECPRGNS